ncbi:MAG: hypothetical protein AVDCRST_MAG64-3387 [uncultured Phycisphaerae bacterium]|uniref:GYD family protein n=1 Tax=uncultured Phycisphaerae bacterium TaxID=904963 RepID=A0A6J4PZ07_9BACT|nr:MAG: hypothetical protein AVDCRST_MAG64-3387 [uncultured Phycisphaerae bacterium]
MATFIVLIDFTDQGMRGIEDSPQRATAFRQAAGRAGVTVREVYWTLGGHDGVLILEAPDDVSVAAALVALGRLGNVRTHALRAFGPDEVQSILAKVV